MDIPVSRLNNRMALQLPAQLPLGLVFVVGEVSDLQAAGETEPLTFRIREGAYLLRCRLTSRATMAVAIKEGDRVRAGGHLAFDSNAAHYYLLARDVEVVSETLRPAERPRSALATILEDVRRRSEANSLVAAELPPWVQKLAPPEVRAEMGWPDDEVAETAVAESAAAEDSTSAITSPEATGLTDELFALLSEAMDSAEEVELTPEMLAQWSVATPETAAASAPPPAELAPHPDEPVAPVPEDDAWLPPVPPEPEWPALPPDEATAIPPPAPAPPAARRQPRDRGIEYLIVGLALGMLILIGILLVWFLLLGL